MRSSVRSRWGFATAIFSMLLVKAESAQAQAAPHPRAPAAAQSDYKAAIARGRQALSAQSYAEAVQAFEAALHTRPEDGVALSELGWAAFLAGDETRARDATVRALARPLPPNVRAATLYNLGRIEEKKGDAQAAMSAYRQSLALRKNSEVSGRLAALDPSLPSITPLTPKLLQGPFPSLDALCSKVKKEPKETCSADFPSSEHFPLRDTLTAPPSPLLGVKVLSVRPPGSDVNRCVLTIQVAGGWYGTELQSDNGCFPMAINSEASSSGRPAALTLHMLTFPATIEHAGKQNERWTGYYQEWLYLCATGLSGKPGCAGPVDLGKIPQLRMERRKLALAKGEDAPPPEWDYRRKAAINKEGILRIEPEAFRIGDPLPAMEHLGSHIIRFP